MDKNVTSKLVLCFPIIISSIVIGIQYLATFVYKADTAFVKYGVIPRTITGFDGIFLMHFVHLHWPHAVWNTVFILIMSYSILWVETKFFVKSSVMIMLCAGFGTWLIGGEGSHVGTSGLVYGYFGILCYFMCISQKTLIKLIATANVLFLCFMLIKALASGATAISWESHLLGALCGVFCGYFFYRNSLK